ncbi:MAG: hypothetical protein J6D44_06155 [Pseudomonas sp.]|nr:hypothetical protein [Pseudomonas sp.]
MNVTINGTRYVPAQEPCENPGLLDFVWSFPDAGGDMPIRDYLRELLATLWMKQDCFSGKRPFGNSCWDIDLYRALCGAGAIDAPLDENGIYDPISGEQMRKGHKIIYKLIVEMCRGSASSDDS